MEELKAEHRRVNERYGKFEAMVKALEPYGDIRKRFLEVYRRDVLMDITEEGRKKIHQGNEVAHHGEVIADTALYSSFQREDEETLTKIYGLDRERRK